MKKTDTLTFGQEMQRFPERLCLEKVEVPPTGKTHTGEYRDLGMHGE